MGGSVVAIESENQWKAALKEAGEGAVRF